MDYMDQSVPCSVCGCETSMIVTKICHFCEAQAVQDKRDAAWKAKPDTEKAQELLESWANPSHMTFSKEGAAFVLKVFKKCLVKAPEPQPALTKLCRELMLSKMTHNFTFSRDEMVELLGGQVKVSSLAMKAPPPTALGPLVSQVHPDSALPSRTAEEHEKQALRVQLDILRKLLMKTPLHHSETRFDLAMQIDRLTQQVGE